MHNAFIIANISLQCQDSNMNLLTTISLTRIVDACYNGKQRFVGRMESTEYGAAELALFGHEQLFCEL